MTRRPARREFRPQTDVPLAPLTTLGVGGACALVHAGATTPTMSPRRIAGAERAGRAAVRARAAAATSSSPTRDSTASSCTLRSPAATFDDGRRRHARARSAPARPWDAVVADAVARGLAGSECLSGIPGSVGGTPIQNVGAYGQEVADTIDRCRRCSIAHEAAHGLPASRVRLRLSHEPLQGRGCRPIRRLRGDVPAAPGPADRRRIRTSFALHRHGMASPSRWPTLRAGRAGGSAAERDGHRRERSRYAERRIVLHESARLRDDQARIASARGRVGPGFSAAGGRVKMPAAWLIEQRRLRARVRCGTRRVVVQASARHRSTAGRDGTRRAESGGADQARVADRFGDRLRPEPVVRWLSASDAEVAYLQETRD